MLMRVERLSALGMISAEKVFFDSIEDFNKWLIDLFTRKTKLRLDLKYRSV